MLSSVSLLAIWNAEIQAVFSAKSKAVLAIALGILNRLGTVFRDCCYEAGWWI